MREISTEIDIASSPARVWDVLTRFDAFPEWNPFIRKVSGELREGGRLEVQIQPPGQNGMTFRPVLVSVRPHRSCTGLAAFGSRGFSMASMSSPSKTCGATKCALSSVSVSEGSWFPFCGDLWTVTPGAASRK